MPERTSGIALLSMLSGLLLLGSPLAAGAEWIKDDLRINLRAGAGNQYRILRVLKSGEQVRVEAAEGDWELVVTDRGQEGWIPSGYTEKRPPPSIRLPEVESQLATARKEIEQLKSQISAQSVEVEELADLRAQVEDLTTSNVELAGSSRWKMLATGGAIVLVGMLIGVLVPRGGSQRTRRIKL